MKKVCFLTVFIFSFSFLWAQPNLRPISITPDMNLVITKSFYMSPQVDIWSNPYTSPEVSRERLKVFFDSAVESKKRAASLADVLSENVCLHIFGKTFIRLYGGIFYKDEKYFVQVTAQNIDEVIKTPRPFDVMMADEAMLHQIWNSIFDGESVDKDFDIFLGRQSVPSEKNTLITFQRNILEGDHKYVYTYKIHLQLALLQMKYK